MLRKQIGMALIFGLLIQGPAFAGGDQLELKDGTLIEGDLVVRNQQEVYFYNNERRMLRFENSQVKNIKRGPKVTFSEEARQGPPKPQPLER